MKFDLDSIPMQKNEVKVPNVVKKCTFVPPVDMRIAPETLLLEFFRHVFFLKYDDSWSDDGKPKSGRPRKQELDPYIKDNEGAFVFGPEEQAVVAAIVNKRKQSKRSNVKEMTFYGPAYPALARDAWVDDSRNRSIERVLFNGIFSQYVYGNNQDSQAIQKKQELEKAIIQASIGTPRSADDGTGESHDILRDAIGDTKINERVDIDKAKDFIGKEIKTDEVLDGVDDPFAARLTKDALAVFKLESELPRLQWVKIFMTYLRFALPMWVLARMKMVVIFHDLLIRAFDDEEVPSLEEIVLSIKTRYKKLLRPALTPSRDLQDSIDEFMRKRVELSVLMYCLEKLDKKTFSGKIISVKKKGGQWLPISEMLSKVKSLKNKFKTSEEWGGAPSLRVFISRCCEKFPAWINPNKKGQAGNNIDEFWRVLRRPAKGDDMGGHLITTFHDKEMHVFPGELLIQTVTQLAAMQKRESFGGQLVLEDVETHFSEYGVDFSSTADVRPQLMKNLQGLGLLQGSPDSGPSVAVHKPF